MIRAVRTLILAVTFLLDFVGAICVTPFVVIAFSVPIAWAQDSSPVAAMQPSPNLIQNPMLAQRTLLQGVTMPVHWKKASWGDAQGAVFTYPVPTATGADAAQVSIASYASAGLGHGAAEWYFEPVAVTPGAFYVFSDFYQSDAESYLTVQWTRLDGTQYYETIASLPATGKIWHHAPQYYFTAPADAVMISILHQLQSTGTLAVDDYSLTASAPAASESFAVGRVSLTFDDGYLDYYTNAFPILQSASGGAMQGTFYMIPAVTRTYGQYVAPDESFIYMSPAQMLEMQAAGNDMASHTENHCDLVTLSEDPTSWSTLQGCRDHPLSSPTTAQAEVEDSQHELASMGVSPDNSMAYPFGSFNSAVESLVKNAGFKGARSTDIGYNSKTADLFALKTQNVGIGTTFETVKSWIDTAAKHRLWLILTFHNIDSPEKLKQEGAVYGTTPETLRQIVTYLASQRSAGKIEVKTVAQALAN